MKEKLGSIWEGLQVLFFFCLMIFGGGFAEWLADYLFF